MKKINPRTWNWKKIIPVVHNAGAKLIYEDPRHEQVLAWWPNNILRIFDKEGNLVKEENVSYLGGSISDANPIVHYINNYRFNR